MTRDRPDQQMTAEVPMSEQPDHELEVLEDDETVPPRPEESVADADREG